MKEQKNTGRGIFYGVIGVATLVVAIIGATFAYFTATATNATNITGNMASVSFGLQVSKVTTADEKLGGMIPMSNSMVEAAVKGTNKTDVNAATGTPQICVDDNGNAVCQIYKISVTNNGTAGMFLDGYVTLQGGSDKSSTEKAVINPPDYTATNKGPEGTGTPNNTTMRWAQVFCTGTDNALTGCTTVGKTTTRATTPEAGGTAGIDNDWIAINKTETVVSDTSGLNKDQIKTTFDDVAKSGKIAGNSYDIININYIRVSDHILTMPGDPAATESFDRKTDVTSALVFNQRIDPKGTKNADATTIVPTAASSDSSKKYTDGQVYYIVVWLTETGRNQTAGQEGVTTGGEGGTTGLQFFKGTVSFVSAQGSEVTATFSSYAAVKSDKATS